MADPREKRKFGRLLKGALLFLTAVILMLTVVSCRKSGGESDIQSETVKPETAAADTITTDKTASDEPPQTSPESSQNASESESEAPKTETQTKQTEPQSTTESEPVMRQTSDGVIDFDELKRTNPDICGWIKIDDTDINYPILQSASDNAYYLRHDIDGNYSVDGSIFMENYNNADFSDYMTVVYGHAMKWGTMFTPLLDYRDNVFYDSHRIITIYTPDGEKQYKIFAAYVWDTRHLLLNIDFTSRITRSVYLGYVKGLRGMNCIVSDDVTPDADDHILTLSCCTFTKGERFLVQGVLIGNE